MHETDDSVVPSANAEGTAERPSSLALNRQQEHDNYCELAFEATDALGTDVKSLYNLETDTYGFPLSIFTKVYFLIVILSQSFFVNLFNLYIFCHIILQY